MSIFDTIKTAAVTNGHGEVNFLRIDAGTVNAAALQAVSPDALGYIVGHSESGHHHVLEREGVTLLQGNEAGMAILYAILTKPTRLFQSAGDPHAEQIIGPGEYIITNNIDYDPWVEQARRVAD